MTTLIIVLVVLAALWCLSTVRVTFVTQRQRMEARAEADAAEWRALSDDEKYAIVAAGTREATWAADSAATQSAVDAAYAAATATARPPEWI